MSVFDPNVFQGGGVFDTDDDVSPDPVVDTPRHGIKLNAYKAFKTLNDFRGMPRYGN